jgi:YD repeat-containing protein
MLHFHNRITRALLAIITLSTSALGSGALAGTTAYAYDALGRLAKATYPDSKQVCYNYDKAGNRTQVTKIAGTCTPTGLSSTSTSLAQASGSNNVVASTVDETSTGSEDTTSVSDSNASDSY